VQPGYFPRRDGGAAPIGGLADRQSFIVGHCTQRFSRPSLRIAYRGVAFTERGQHLNRQLLKSAFPVGAFFAQYRLGI
jgi:hypothetical protein